MGATSGEQEASQEVAPAEEVPADADASTEAAPAEEADASAAAAPADASTAEAEGASDPASADAVVLPDPIKDATTAASAAVAEGPAHLSSPLNLGNISHTFGGGKGKSLLPEVTITKEFDHPSNHSDDFKLEKPDLPAKPKFSLTKIEHIMDKPQMPDESKKKIHITEKKWKDTVRIVTANKHQQSCPVCVDVTSFRWLPSCLCLFLSASLLAFFCLPSALSLSLSLCVCVCVSVSLYVCLLNVKLWECVQGRDLGDNRIEWVCGADRVPHYPPQVF
jgi:hypothetical protein